MKTTSILSAIRESSEDELKERLKRLEEELFQNKLKRYTNQLENTNLIRAARREIAQVKTILAARAHGHEEKAAKTAPAPDAKEKAASRDTPSASPKGRL